MFLFGVALMLICFSPRPSRQKGCSKAHSTNDASNQSLEPPLAAAKSTFNFMKQFFEFAMLVAASSGSAPSR
jgi:hypothetical protein